MTKRRAQWIAALGAWVILAALAGANQTQAPKFYPDDPLAAVPEPVAVDPKKIVSRKLSDYYDFFSNLFGDLGERSTKSKPIPSGGVNTLGEVMDGPWFVNRHGRKRMTIEELVRGPRTARGGPPAEGQWAVIGAKTEGVTPGFTIRDPRGVV